MSPAARSQRRYSVGCASNATGAVAEASKANTSDCVNFYWYPVAILYIFSIAGSCDCLLQSSLTPSNSPSNTTSIDSSQGTVRRAHITAGS